MIPGSANPLLLKSAAGGLQISRSIRLNSADSAYFSRVPAVAGNRKTWTWAGWVKRSKGGARQGLFGSLPTTSIFTALEFDATDKLNIYDSSIGGLVSRTTSAVYRDFSAWMHVVLAYDTTNATAAQRVKLYVNGSEITAFSVSADPPLNTDTQINVAQQHVIGSELPAGSLYLDGYLANIHFIDGQALTPSSFTETDATTGQLIPKTYTGSYGTNGFNLLFADNSSNTASTLGKDNSGLGNNWTPNNLSVTAGAGNDSLVDSPTNYGTDTGVGGEVRGNYCTWNSLQIPNNGTSSGSLANGNLEATTPLTTGGSFMGTIGVSSGKWYWEITPTDTGGSPILGVVPLGFAYNTNNVGFAANSPGYRNTGQIYVNSLVVTTVSSYVALDVIGFALDIGAGELKFYKNGVLQSYTVTGLTGTQFPACSDTSSGSLVISVSANFGQRAFAYTAPSGFKALCTQNLPSPLVTKSNTVMDVVTYTGTGAALTPTSSLGFNPDWIWIKSRSAATDHALYDVVRGAQARLESNRTDAEVTTDGGVTAFNSAGFTLGTLAQVNTSAATYVAWCWDAGTSTVSNTAGSITSQVRANATAGFSVVNYTAGATNATVGHGLGVAPGLIIAKSRTSAVGWAVYHSSLGKDGFLVLNGTNAFASNSNYWGTTGPNSTTFGLATSGFFNNDGGMIAYCFAPVVGYSNFGSYVGNGSSTNGPFVYTGFRPRWVMIKGTDGSTTYKNWMIKDALRPSYNVTSGNLYANEALSEDSVSTVNIDFLSNGFKIYGTYGGVNTSADNYIFAAFAESPFNYSRAR